MYKSGAINLLVVDDEPSICRLAQKALAARDRVVTTAGSAEKAMRLAYEQDFDVVLLDILLPDSNGLGLL